MSSKGPLVAAQVLRENRILRLLIASISTDAQGLESMISPCQFNKKSLVSTIGIRAIGAYCDVFQN